MNLSNFDDFLGFIKQMTTILRRKEGKYGDTWKTSNFNNLMIKFNNQKDKLDKLIRELESEKESRARQYVMINLKDTLLDIANYCFFLYERLGVSMIL